MKKTSKSAFARCGHCLEQFDSTKVWIELVQRDGGPRYLSGICEACAKKNRVETTDLETDLAFHKRLNSVKK